MFNLMNARHDVVSITIGNPGEIGGMARPNLTLSLVCAICAALTQVSVAAPSVTAVLSNSDVQVGEMVQLEIRLSDAGSAVVPNGIHVDGLEIHQTGTSRQFELRNFTTTSSITYNYTVLPLKAGTFKIPSQTVQVGGNSFKTPELTLRVSAVPGQPQNQPNPMPMLRERQPTPIPTDSRLPNSLSQRRQHMSVK